MPTRGDGPRALLFLVGGAGDAGRLDEAFLLPISKEDYFCKGFELDGLFVAGLALGVAP